jgi:lysozyme family protein
MTDRFGECLARVLRQEGGWSDDPNDNGGPTNQGITIDVLATFRGEPPLPRAPGTRRKPGRHIRTDPRFVRFYDALRALTDDERDHIYLVRYWMPVQAGKLPCGIDFAVFDYAVNSGIGRAAKVLQRELGTTDDGIVGQVTLTAAAHADPRRVVAGIAAERRAFLRSLGDFRYFGTGWLRRVDETEALALGDLAPVAPVADAGPARMLGIAALDQDEAPTETDAKRSAKAVVLPETREVQASTTVWSAVVAAVAAVALLLQGLNAIAEQLVKGARLAGDLHLTAGVDPLRVTSVGLGMAALFAAIYLVMERRRKAVQG